MRGVSALDILVKDDVFVYQNDTEDMGLAGSKTNAAFSGQQSEGSGCTCQLLNAP